MKVVFAENVEVGLIGYKPTSDSLGRFRKWHVESLLNQAADLLDRCLRDRSQYNDLRFRWEQLEFERKETEQSQALLDEQVKAGMLTVEIDKLDKEVSEKNADDAAHAAIVADLEAHYRPTGNPQAHGLRAIWRQGELSKKINLLDAGIKGMQLSWEQKSKNFREKSIESAKEIRRQKTDEMKGEGAFNLKEQFRMLAESITRDFKDAYDRMRVAYDGLVMFYAFDRHAGHQPPPTLNPNTDRFGPIDASVLWTREAIRWLIAFGQLDQGWTYSFSVRALVGDAEWGKAVGHGKTEADFTFILPRALFDSHTFVRMRGMSMFAVGDKLFLPLSASARLPRRAISHQIWAVGASTYTSIDQTALPNCYWGRVETRSSPRMPDVVGLVSLMNASPISDTDFKTDGNWEVRIRTINAPGADLDGLTDLHVELSLTGKPK